MLLSKINEDTILKISYDLNEDDCILVILNPSVPIQDDSQLGLTEEEDEEMFADQAFYLFNCHWNKEDNKFEFESIYEGEVTKEV